MSENTEKTAAAAGEFRIGGDLPVTRLGYGAMQLTGEGVWGWPADRDNAVAVLRRAVEARSTVIVDAGDTQYELDVHPTRATSLPPDLEQVARTIAGIRKATGCWKHLVDAEQLTADLYERRRMTRRLPVD